MAGGPPVKDVETGRVDTHLLINHDTKYAAGFDAVFAAAGTEVARVGPRAADMNASAERRVRTLRAVCRGHFLVPVRRTGGTW